MSLGDILKAFNQSGGQPGAVQPMQSPIGMPPVGSANKEAKNEKLALMLYALGGALGGKDIGQSAAAFQQIQAQRQAQEQQKKQRESLVGWLQSQGATPDQINLFKDNPTLANAYITSTFQQPKSSAERFSIFDKRTGLPTGTVLKSEAETWKKSNTDPNLQLGPLSALPRDTESSIEIKELVDENNIFIENLTERDWKKRKEAGTLPPGSKLQNLGTGQKAADSPNERLDKSFAPITEKFIASEILITGLSDTAKILAENPQVANDIVSGGAKVYSFIESNVKGFDNLVTKGKNSAVYNDVTKSKTSYDSKRNWSKEIDDLVSATGIAESRIIDMAFALSASKGQEGKGLSDRDFQNAIDMLSKGFNAQQKIALFNDITNRIQTEFNIEKSAILRVNPELQEKYDALGDLSSFINPYTTTQIIDPLEIR
ncbi:hypothetical protein N9Y18_06400 [Litoricolaceae bacterium]|nr:hypothetical protein [Litorivicinaceae bacterium]